MCSCQFHSVTQLPLFKCVYKSQTQLWHLYSDCNYRLIIPLLPSGGRNNRMTWSLLPSSILSLKWSKTISSDHLTFQMFWERGPWPAKGGHLKNLRGLCGSLWYFYKVVKDFVELQMCGIRKTGQVSPDFELRLVKKELKVFNIWFIACKNMLRLNKLVETLGMTFHVFNVTLLILPFEMKKKKMLSQTFFDCLVFGCLLYFYNRLCSPCCTDGNSCKRLVIFTWCKKCTHTNFHSDCGYICGIH